MPKKRVILDRENGLIYYNDWFYLPERVSKFEEIIGHFNSKGESSVGLMITPPPKTDPPSRGYKLFPRAVDISWHCGYFWEDWAFMVWYMDKNRPLPPGDAFDPYRQEDFERRKAEGFPPPLYPTRFLVDTPEATEEQQKERRASWSDNEYYVRTKSKWY